MGADIQSSWSERILFDVELKYRSTVSKILRVLLDELEVWEVACHTLCTFRQ